MIAPPPEVDVYLGKMITADRRLRFFSATSVERYDPAQGGCPRKFAYRYIEGIKDPPRESAEIGKRAHRELRAYLTTGVDTLGPVARLSKHLLPDPGPDLIVEQSLVTVGDERPEPAITGLVQLEGRPLVGAPDLAHGRCTNRGVSDIEDTIDPPGTFEVIDHKTTGRVEYAKGPEELRRAFQMIGYAEHFRLKFRPTWIRLSHHYMRTDVKNQPAFKRTIRVSAQEIADRFGSFQPVARRMIDTALATSVDEVEGNTMACSAYGGCMHRDYCTAFRHDSLARSFGERAAAFMLAAPPPREVNPIMSLLAGITAPGASVIPAATPPVTPALATVSPELVAALGVIAAGARAPFNVGWPALTGEASVLKAAWEGVLVSPTDRYEGSGVFSPATLAAAGKPPMTAVSDPAQLIALAGDLIRTRGVPSQPAPPVPVVVAPPVQVTATLTLPPPVAPPVEPAPVVTAPSTLTPSDQPPIQTSAQIAAATPEKKRRGRPRKDNTAAAPGPNGAATIAPDEPHTEVAIFVDCVPSCGTIDLWPRVLDLCEQLRKGGAEVVDIRAAAGDHPLAFGRWKGALAACVRTMVDELSPGAYSFAAGSDELAAVAADAMRGADLYVRGVR